MDDASFALKESTRQLLTAGVRHILQAGIAVGTAPEASAGISVGAASTYAGVSSHEAQTRPHRHVQTSIFDSPPWSEFLRKTPQRPLSLWTYREYPLDAIAEQTPATRRLWVDLLSRLNLPRGSIGFFPYTLPEADDLTHYETVFAQVVGLRQPRSVILFCDDPSNSLEDAIQKSTGFVLQRGFHLFPSPATLLGYEPTQLDALARSLLWIVSPDMDPPS